MKYLLDLEPLPYLQNVIVQDLRDLGVKVDLSKKESEPTIKKSKSKEDSLNVCGGSLVFGNSLVNVPSVFVRGCGQVPRFLFDAIQLLEKNIDVEGLFRKSGSVQRLKDLRLRVDSGDSLSDAHPLDIASLLKQFLRELPEPLFTASLHDIFVQCVHDNAAISEAVPLACLLLPPCNLATLRYVSLFLSRVAASSGVNRMDAANLAVCLAPNLLYADNSKTSVTDSTVLIAETAVVRFLVEHAPTIGMVSNSLIQRAGLMSACFASDVEDQNVSTCPGVGPTGAKVMKRKKKKRSGSLQGLVTTLSASFSRWRSHKDRIGHNTSSVSDRSTVSYVSFDKSSVMIDNDNDNDNDDLGISEYHETTVAATPKLMRKRKAEDETLPFSTSKKKAILSSMPHRSILGGTPFTPHVRKAPGMDLRHRPDIEFAPGVDDMVFSAATPKLPSAKQYANHPMSSVSSSRLRRKNSLGKSGCFSPKTPKGSLRHSFRGFLRRLSGSRDRQNTSTGVDVSQTSDVADRISTASSEQVLLSESRGGSCRKMVSTLFGRRQKMPSSSSCHVSSLEPSEYSDTLVDDHQDAEENIELSSSLMNRNEVKVAADKEFARDVCTRHNMSLPPQQSRAASSGDRTPGGSTNIRRGRPNSIMSGLHSPLLKQAPYSCIVSATLPVGRRDNVAVIDTSPILARPAMGLSRDNDKENVEEPDMYDAADDEFDLAALPRYPSKISIDMGADIMADESTHNQAFTESMLVEPELVAGQLCDDEEPNQEAESTNSIALCAVGAVGENGDLSSSGALADPAKGADVNAILPVPSSKEPAGSTTSLDSAVDVCSPDSVQIQRNHSQGSMTSHDSGVCIAALSANQKSISDCKNGDGSLDHSSLEFTREGSRSIRIRSSIRRQGGRPNSFDPNLQVTPDLHSLLTKAGVQVEEVKLPPVESAQACKVKGALNEVASDNVSDGFVGGATVNDLREIFERHASPLRFANSTSRTLRAASPTTQSLKSEAGVAGKPPLSSTKRVAILPISTNLLRVSLESDCVTMKSSRSSESAAASIITEAIPRTPGTGCGPPRIKSALLTPSMMTQRLGNRVNAPQSARARSPGKPVKRLQVSPARVQRSPRKQSPRCVAANHASSTISVPFNLDI